MSERLRDPAISTLLYKKDLRRFYKIFQLRGLPTEWRFALAFFGLQFLFLTFWALIRYERFSLTRDFSIYYQSWSDIQRGTLNPYDSIEKYYFWQNHGEFMLWPLAFLTKLWPSPMALLSLQNLASVGSEIAVFDIVRVHIFKKGVLGKSRKIALGLLVVLLVLNFGFYEAISWDFHFEIIGAFFVILTLRALLQGGRSSRILPVWVLFAILSGDVTTSYIVIVGVGCLVVLPFQRKLAPALVVFVSVGAFLAFGFIGADQGSELSGFYGYLVGNSLSSSHLIHLNAGKIVVSILKNPIEVASIVWSKRTDIFANIAPSGLIGILDPLALLISGGVLAQSSLASYSEFIVPGFQNFLVYMIMPFGSVLVLLRITLNLSRKALFGFLSSLLFLNAVAWAIIWIPTIPMQWLRVDVRASSVLENLLSRIPANAPVVVSQGISGRFSGRPLFFTLSGQGTLPDYGAPTWIIIAPQEGIETLSVAQSIFLIHELSLRSDVEFEGYGSGIWFFRWSPTSASQPIAIPGEVTSLPAYAFSGTGGLTQLGLAPALSHLVSNGRPGYVVSRDYWVEPPGRYLASIGLASTCSVNVEVWNTTGGVLLARRTVPASGVKSLEAVTMIADATKVFDPKIYGGFGFFKVRPFFPKYNELEIRVWSPGSCNVEVGNLSVVPQSG